MHEHLGLFSTKQQSSYRKGMGRAEVKFISNMVLEELILLPCGGKYLALKEENLKMNYAPGVSRSVLLRGLR